MGVQLRRLIAFALFCLLCVLGTTSRSHAQDNTLTMSNQSAAPAMGSHPISPANWSFECFLCLHGPWITTQAQPGTVRLWMSGTEWAFLDTGRRQLRLEQLGHLAGSDCRTPAAFGHLHVRPDSVLDFQYHIATIKAGAGHNYSASPPSDLTSSGSPSFNAFVTALVQHCSPAGNCVKDYIGYWEMWNEANIPEYWTGTPAQLYDMFAPVIPIIRNNIPDVKILTPPVCGGEALGWRSG